MSPPSAQLAWLKADIDEINRKLDVLQEERQQRIGAAKRTALVLHWVAAVVGSLSLSSFLAVVALWRHVMGQQ